MPGEDGYTLMVKIRSGAAGRIDATSPPSPSPRTRAPRIAMRIQASGFDSTS